MTVFAAIACSVVRQDCPAGQLCAAPGDDRECADTGHCEPIPSATSTIELSLPVPAGDHVYCGKGNLRPHTTHNACNPWSRYAFDLISSAYDPPHLVLASADGVAYFAAGCSSTDLNSQAGQDRCNEGRGNVVLVQHTPDLYSQYAHLSAILVHGGQRVKRGQPIGIEGNTGLAGAKHLHWSLHHGNASTQGGPSVPMTRIRTTAGIFRADQLHCGDWTKQWTPDPKTRYLSDNALVRPLERFFFWPSVASLRGLTESTDPETRRQVIEALRDFGEEAIEARYWLGVALQTEGRLDESRRTFEALSGNRGAPSWMSAWLRLRLGQLDVARGEREAGRREIQAALREAPLDRELQRRGEASLSSLAP